MNWEAIGAIGELVGAVAVVATLAYLAIQLRQNTRAMTSATFQELGTTTAKNMEMLASDPHLVELMYKTQNGLSSLTDQERMQFGAFAHCSMRRIDTVYVQELLEAIEPKYTAGFKNSALSTLGHKGFMEWWNTSKESFNDEFINWIDTAIRTGDFKGLHFGIGIPTDSLKKNESASGT